MAPDEASKLEVLILLYSVGQADHRPLRRKALIAAMYPKRASKVLLRFYLIRE